MTGEVPSSGPGRQRRYRGRAFEERRLADGQSYREVNRLAVLSLVCGVLSILTALSWLFISLPLAGFMLGYLALVQIRRAPGEMTGRGLAIAGLALSGVFWLLGSGFMVFCAVNEVPIGYTRLSFKDLEPNPDHEGELLPPEILELEDQYVYIKGYMYPGRQATGIQQFVLVASPSHCNICQMQLKSTDMIEVHTMGDVLADFSTQPTGVGGKLKISPQEARRPLGGMPYVIEADYLYQ